MTTFTNCLKDRQANLPHGRAYWDDRMCDGASCHNCYEPFSCKLHAGSYIGCGGCLAERRGLRSLEGKSDLLREAEESSRRLGIYRDEKSLTDLRNLVPIESGGSDLGKCLSRLAEPVASWNAENVETPVVRVRCGGFLCLFTLT